MVGRRTAACISTGAKTVQGTVELELTPAPLATLMRHMFGTINTTGSGPYTHTASLGIAFSMDSQLPETWRSGLFVAQHGSWNRRPKSGYKVIYVPFKDGKPSGQPVDVLTGFLSAEEKAQGRPVGVTFDRAGALLVADDVGNTVWRVSAK